MADRKRIFRGDRLRLIREARGYSQDDLAQLLGLGNTQIYKYETGKTDPSSEVIVRLARQLEVTTDYLLGLVADPQAHVEENDLTPDERKLLSAFRRGDLRGAMLILARDAET